MEAHSSVTFLLFDSLDPQWLDGQRVVLGWFVRVGPDHSLLNTRENLRRRSTLVRQLKTTFRVLTFKITLPQHLTFSYPLLFS